jgi:hypothetical protein
MALALIAVLLTHEPEALVPRDPAPAVLREAMHAFVRGERRSIIPFAIAGASTLAAAALLLQSSGALERGAAWPLLGFGILELAAGLFFGLRNERPRLDALLDENPAEFVAHETKKVSRISGTFQPILLGVEAALIAAGGLMAGLGAERAERTLEGVGIGLAIQGLVFFVIDWAVLDRADDYLAVLRTFG